PLNYVCKINKSCIILTYKSGDFLEAVWKLWGNAPDQKLKQQFCKVNPLSVRCFINQCLPQWIGEAKVVFYLLVRFQLV
ncbi:MAG: hypothetical protein DRJ13_06925, partial [Bacteroidetes bacterium]